MIIKNNVLVSVLPSDIKDDGSFIIPDGITTIGSFAFQNCIYLIKVIMPDTVTIIENYAFVGCSSLVDINISKNIKSIGKCAFAQTNLISEKNVYKAFERDMRCLCYQYYLKEWAKKKKHIRLCKKGYHYCTNLFEIFNYYYGELDKDIVICLCKIGDNVIRSNTSKCVTNTIKPVKRLSKAEIIKILNSE